jgi:DNA repair photolyase
MNPAPARRVTVRLKEARQALTVTRIPGYDYCLNPYTGCGHGCLYCYAQFMIRFSGHTGERWGGFVDVKHTAPGLLLREVRKRKRGQVLLSTVTDPYQPLEKKYRLTRQCLEILAQVQWPVTLLTKSPLVTRDVDILSRFQELEAGLSIATNREAVRKLLEPFAPPIPDRIQALRRLKSEGIATYAFVGPLLPMDPEELAEKLEPVADSVLLDKLNYPGRVQSLLRRERMDYLLDPDYLAQVHEVFRRVFGEDRVSVVFEESC